MKKEHEQKAKTQRPEPLPDEILSGVAGGYPGRPVTYPLRNDTALNCSDYSAVPGIDSIFCCFCQNVLDLFESHGYHSGDTLVLCKIHSGVRNF